MQLAACVKQLQSQNRECKVHACIARAVLWCGCSCCTVVWDTTVQHEQCTHGHSLLSAPNWTAGDNA